MNGPTNARTTARSERSVIAFLAFIGVLMAFGIDAALPAFDELRAEFDLDERGISAAVTGTVYFAGMAIGQLACGVLGDRLGRRPVLAGGLTLYAVAAAASALAPTLETLLIARFVWGLGASAPSVLRFAIARDLYAGDRMARVVSIFMAFFLIGPILVPFVGEAILTVGSWRTVFAGGVMLSLIAIAWTIKFGETMDPGNRRPIRLGSFGDAFAAVSKTPQTRWALIGSTLFTAQFFTWLGSAEPVISSIYDRGEQFTIFFGLSGAGMAVALLLNNRFIDRFGISSMLRSASSVHVAVSFAGLAIVLAAGGIPSIWPWFAWALAANAMTMVLGPMSSALAMDPMGDKAGTVSAILGLSQLGVGSVLAAVVDAQMDDTVTPMLVGAIVFGVPGAVALWAATSVRSEHSRSVA
ncbi:MAG: MFS transporter [Ilumatobacter sp.]